MPAGTKRPAPPGLVWLEDATEILGVEKSTLYKWRYLRTGPASFKYLGKVVYRLTELHAYIAGCEAADSRSNPELNPLNRRPEPRLSSRRPAAA